MKKVEYKVKISTGDSYFDRSWSKVYIKLVGEDGESKRTRLHGTTAKESTYTVSCSKSIGKLVLIELEKMKTVLLREVCWFVDKVKVTSPENDTYTFPIHQWIKDEEIHRFREGTALVVAQNHSLLGKYTREVELQERRKQYCWTVYKDGLPHCIAVENPLCLPCEVQFSFTKGVQFGLTAVEGMIEIKLSHLGSCEDNWKSFDAICKIFDHHRNPVSEYVQKHWKDDAFFGYQFLNGLNPMLIRRCSSLPTNLPVTDNMLFPNGAGNLAQEMQKGNIFLCDYAVLDGVKTNVIHGKKQHLVAPLVLLQQTPEGELKPIAIQLKQKPADDNPIFLPTDSEYDWLLAKTFVRSAYFNDHELNIHLLHTHLLAEVFALSLLRNLPMVHPLYKLLMPHTRYTLQINVLARQFLISDKGDFTLYTSSGGDGMVTILQRSLSALTYRSLCLPDDITDRGVESVLNYHYRDDGLKLWDIIYRFVERVLSFYYRDDGEVEQDPELQNWIQDIFEHGFLSKESSGIPQCLSTLPELFKFVTMVIFISSAQHAAVNSGQFDFGAWMPNLPTTLQLPPPTRKGTATEDTLLNTLPDISTTAHAMAVLYLLSKQSTDFVALGQYPNAYFTEETPLSLITVFQKELEDLRETIKKRNNNQALPYEYLDPKKIENSVSL